MGIKHIYDHIERLFTYLPSYLREKTGIQALIRALGDAFQEFEGNVYDIYTGEFFSQARGARLDAWGETYGVLRLGLDDLWYRRLIVGTLRARQSQGRVDDCVSMWKGFTGADIVEFQELPPRGIMLVAWVEDYMPDGYARRAADTFRLHAPGGGKVLAEALRVGYLGGYSRTSPPYGTPMGSGIPARTY